MSDEPTMGTAPSRPERLGDRLRAAREAAGIELSELAHRTHVRRAYLEALEDGRYADLPEDVYTRNFVRLHAQTVGLDPAPLLSLYARERFDAIGRSTLERRLDHDRREAGASRGPGADPSVPARPAARTPRPARGQDGVRLPAWLGPTFATVVLVAVVVGLAAWGVDRFFANPPVAPASSTATATEEAGASPSDAAATSDDAADDTPGDGVAANPLTGPGATVDAIVRVDLITEPPGAEVTVDGFAVPGRTPILDVPFSARAERVVRAELEGFAVAQEVVDLLEDGQVLLTLVPLDDGPGAVEPAAAGALTLAVVDTTWLEVYAGDARNEGERLVYPTAQAGDRYAFDLPVYVYVGNAAGVRVSLEGQDLGAMGGPGAVLGRAFGP